MVSRITITYSSGLLGLYPTILDSVLLVLSEKYSSFTKVPLASAKLRIFLYIPVGLSALSIKSIRPLFIRTPDSLYSPNKGTIRSL